jgi:olfactory receptor
LNPLIYSLRNKEVARAFMKVLRMDKAAGWVSWFLCSF